MNKDKIKIVYLINGLGSGGAEAMLYRLLQRLDRSLFQPYVVALLDIEGPLKQHIEKLGIETEIIGFRSKKDVGSVLRLYRMLKVINPDILHTQLFASDILGRVFGRRLKIPIVITSIRNEYYGGKHRDLLIRWTEKYTDATTIVSEVAAQRFISEKVIDHKKLQVIYSGIDPDSVYHGLNDYAKTDVRLSVGLPENEVIILAVGSLTRKKGYFHLLEAAYQLKAQGLQFKLVIVGSGKLEWILKNKTKELNLSESIIFLGRRDDVPKLMAAADIFVLSSLWEGLPGVILEAMASELPVIATAVGGVPELVDDGVTGYIVEPGSPKALADALEKLLLDSDKDRFKMGQAGRNRIENKFHVNMMVAAYETLYMTCWKQKKI